MHDRIAACPSRGLRDSLRSRPQGLWRKLLLLGLATACMAAPARAAQDDLRLEVARQWAEKGDYDKAVQELRLFLNEHPDAAEVYARIGSLRLRQGKHKLAGESFRLALKKDPTLAEAKEGMAKLKELEAAPPESKAPEPKSSEGAAFSPAMDSNSPAEPQGIYAAKEFQDALRQYQEKKPDQALISLRKVLNQSPGHPGAYYLGGVIRYEKGDLGKASFNFKRSFGYPERGYNAHFYLGRIHQRQNQTADAIAHYEAYIRATKSEAGRRQAEALLAQLKGKPDKAQETASAETTRAPAVKATAPAAKDKEAAPAAKAAAPAAEAAKPAHGAAPESHAAAPAPGEAHGDAAHGNKGHGDKPHADSLPPAPAAPPAAERSPSPLVLSQPGYLPFVVADSAGPSGRKLVEAYEAFKKEKFEKSADLLKETIRLYGGSPNAEAADLDLAAVYIRLGLWDNAKDRILAYLSSAREPQRYRDLAFYLEGLMHLGRRDGEKAERALLKVKAGSFGGPAQDEIDWRLAEAGEQMKDMKKTAAYLEKAQASARSPLRKALLWQRLGALHAKHGRPERALEYYRKSLEPCGKSGKPEAAEGLETLCPESRLRVADLEFRRRNWKEALAEYRGFAADFPEHKEAAWAQYQIGNVFQATRNLESALNQYKKVIDNYPDSYWASQAQWKREDAIWRKEYEEVLD